VTPAPEPAPVPKKPGYRPIRAPQLPRTAGVEGATRRSVTLKSGIARSANARITSERPRIGTRTWTTVR
jgi:hypothetical protein